MFNETPLTDEEILATLEPIRAETISVPDLMFRGSIAVGEARLMKTGKLPLYRKAETHPEFQLAANSVREALAQYCENELGIDRNATWRTWSGNKALFLDTLRGLPRERKLSFMKIQAETLMAGLHFDDLDFYRSVGEAVAARPPDTVQGSACTLLNYWLSDFLWLMDAKTLAKAVQWIENSDPRGADDDHDKLVGRLKKARSSWGLHFAKRPLITKFESRGIFGYSEDGKKFFPK